MNREQKLSLIIGFTLILLVGVLISDHLSGARTATVSGVDGDEAGMFDAQLASDQRGPVAPFGVEAEAGATPPVATVPPGPAVTEHASAEADSESETPASEPFTLIDQSAPRAGEDIISRLARQGGDLFEQGRDIMLDLPSRAAPLVQAERPARAPDRWHTVAEGESLWQIADRYYGSGGLWKKLAEHNSERIDKGMTIRVGTRLAIPERGVLDGGAPVAAAAREEPAPASRERTYTVRKNDTVGEIAQKLLGSAKRWREIVELNDIEDENVLYEGQVLAIPAK